MARQTGENSAVKILQDRYIKGNSEREASLETERANAEVAQTIYDLRKQAGLTQAELAEMVGTTQSAISRLEDADYQGHSLSMLSRIAKVLNQKVTVLMTAEDPDMETLRYAFQTTVRNLRRSRMWTVEDLARRLGVDDTEILAMERYLGYRPTPLVIHKLSQLYGVVEQKLAALAGAFADIPSDIQQSASRFAAQSESLALLSEDEKRILDDFVKLLKKE